MSRFPSLHELLAHTHLLSERQRRQGTIAYVGPLLCVHAQGIRDGKPVAVDRFFADKTSPGATLTAMRQYGPEKDNLLFVVDAGKERQRAFVRAGFRLVETQWLMACSLADWQPLENGNQTIEVRRATGAGDAMAISAIPGMEAVSAEELGDPGLMHYYSTVAGTPIAYGRWAGYDESIAWVSHVHTAPAYRRRGHASRLMERILTDSSEAGIDCSLLLATEVAHSLYTGLGYREISPVAIFQASQSLLRRKNRRSR